MQTPGDFALWLHGSGSTCTDLTGAAVLSFDGVVAYCASRITECFLTRGALA